MTATATRAAWLADTLLASPGAELSPAGLAQLRADLGSDLQALGADLPAGERLHLDTYKILVAHRQPDRCMAMDDDRFVPSPRRCRRAVGVAAVSRCVRGLAPGPALAVAEVLAGGLEDATAGPGNAAVKAPWWASWYAGLPRGAQSVVCAEAITWATQLLSAVDWPRFVRPPIVGGRDDWWQCPGGPRLVLKGRADVRVATAQRPALLVVGTGRCQTDWRVELGYPGLVAALVRDCQVAPSRVVGFWPQSGQVRVLPVDMDMLRATATAVIAAVATWVDGRIEAGRAPMEGSAGVLARAGETHVG